MVSGVALGYANIMAMPVLNVSVSVCLISAVNLSQFNNRNNVYLHVNLNCHIINNLLPKWFTNDAITVEQVQRLIERKYGTLIFDTHNITILHKCAIDILIYILYLYIKHKQKLLSVSLTSLMSLTNDRGTTNIEEIN